MMQVRKNLKSIFFIMLALHSLALLLFIIPFLELMNLKNAQILTLNLSLLIIL